MIYVSIEAAERAGRAGSAGNHHDTDDVAEAIARELTCFHSMWEHMGHGAPVGYAIIVATEASSRRTTPDGLPLPEGEEYRDGVWGRAP